MDGTIQRLRHQIHDIVADSETYNGLAGRRGLSFGEQRAEFESLAPRVDERIAALHAQAKELSAKKTEIESLTAQAFEVIASREARQRQPKADEEDTSEPSSEDLDAEDEEETF